MASLRADASSRSTGSSAGDRAAVFLAVDRTHRPFNHSPSTHQNTMNFLLALYAELGQSKDASLRTLAAPVAEAMRPLR
jgi:hypothetical protein